MFAFLLYGNAKPTAVWSSQIKIFKETKKTNKMSIDGKLTCFASLWVFHQLIKTNRHISAYLKRRGHKAYNVSA